MIIQTRQHESLMSKRINSLTYIIENFKDLVIFIPYFLIDTLCLRGFVIHADISLQWQFRDL
jgi:hypothetical protein